MRGPVGPTLAGRFSPTLHTAIAGALRPVCLSTPFAARKQIPSNFVNASNESNATFPLIAI